MAEEEGEKRQSPRLQSKTCLDKEAEQALKMFAQKNRPVPQKAKTAHFKSEGAGLLEVNEEDESDETAPTDERLKKFDIFGNMDAERVDEIEQMFADSLAASNYEDWKKKAKKDPSKFATCSGIDVREDGQRVLT